MKNSLGLIHTGRDTRGEANYDANNLAPLVRIAWRVASQCGWGLVKTGRSHCTSQCNFSVMCACPPIHPRPCVITPLSTFPLIPLLPATWPAAAAVSPVRVVGPAVARRLDAQLPTVEDRSVHRVHGVFRVAFVVEPAEHDTSNTRAQARFKFLRDGLCITVYELLAKFSCLQSLLWTNCVHNQQRLLNKLNFHFLNTRRSNACPCRPNIQRGLCICVSPSPWDDKAESRHGCPERFLKSIVFLQSFNFTRREIF